MSVPEPYAPFIENVKKLFNNSTYSDLTIKCGSRTWSAHKNIVCSRSKWLADALKHPMKEAEENTIELKEIDPDVVEAVLGYLYSYDYGSEGEGEESVTSVSFHVHIHIAADQFGLEDLEKLAVSKFQKRAPTIWQTSEFADAAELVYISAPDRFHQLRDCIITVASTHAESLYNDKDGERFRDVAETIPALGSDLAAQLTKDKARVAKVEGMERYRCNCGFRFAMRM